MSDFDNTLSKISDAYAEIARLEMKASGRDPNPLIAAEIASVKSIAKQLEEEWKAHARLKSIEVFRYRVMHSDRAGYSVSSLFKSISKFQDLFSQVFDSLTNGPKERARLTGGIEQESELSLGYTFPGSFGFVLMADGERGLFEDKFQQTAEAVFQIMATNDQFDVRDLSRQLGQAVVKRMYDWSKANADADYGVDLNWLGTLENEVRKTVDRKYFENMVEIIEATVDKDQAVLEKRGVLLGMDTKTRRFRFHAQPSGEDFAGRVGDAFDLSKDWTLNQKYVAKILSESETRYATLETKFQFTLVGLSE